MDGLEAGEDTADDDAAVVAAGAKPGKSGEDDDMIDHRTWSDV
jgi:hypothetical protein